MNRIIYTIKDDKISWNSLHDLLWNAHSENRRNGVIMSFPSLSGCELKEKIEKGNGTVFVAMDGDKIVASAAYTIVKGLYWFCKDYYIYLCLDAILPEYAGRGIYKILFKERENSFRTHNKDVVVFETHERNKRMIDIQLKNGFRKVRYKRCKDGHHNVMLAKWYGQCPFSDIRIYLYYILSFFKVKMQSSVVYRLFRMRA